MMATKIILISTILFSFGCANLHRSPGSGYADGGRTSDKIKYVDNRVSSGPMYDAEYKKTAYELGFNPEIGLNYDEHEAVQNRVKRRQLEKRLSSKKEKEQYSKALPWFKDDAEINQFLNIPTLEGRQAWILRNNIWDRSKTPDSEMKALLESQDIAVGMPMELVKKSWGEPLAIDISGNPIYRNQRWKYQRQVSAPDGFKKETRLVYFEGGRVVGWETE